MRILLWPLRTRRLSSGSGLQDHCHAAGHLSAVLRGSGRHGKWLWTAVFEMTPIVRYHPSRRIKYRSPLAKVYGPGRSVRR